MRAASLIGAVSLICNAKGNPFGQLLMILFSLVYGVILFHQAYSGERLMDVGMTAPMALAAMISWLNNPNPSPPGQVEAGRIGRRQIIFMFILTIVVTGRFCFILKAFPTAQPGLSTISVAASFIAVLLTYYRSPFDAMGYAANDIVLIALWSLAAGSDPSCISVVACFVIFLANDLYGFVCWIQRQKQQEKSQPASLEEGCEIKA